MGAFAMRIGPVWNLDAIYPVVLVAVKVMNRDGHPNHDVIFVYLSMNRIRDGHPSHDVVSVSLSMSKILLIHRFPLWPLLPSRSQHRK
ncbi:hypothetical protein SDJN03_06928, partial [Cucurbita argyrosperma subsp. sororia]